MSPDEEKYERQYDDKPIESGDQMAGSYPEDGFSYRPAND